MHLRRRLDIARDERGMTLAEMVVAMAIGGIVLVATTTLVLGTMRATTKVSKRVESTSNSRIVLTDLVDELNSSCIMPKVAPIREGSSGGELRFVHARGSAVTPTPILSKISLDETAKTTLVQRDYAYVSGNAPYWVFNESKPISTTQLMTGVSQISASQPLFRYYAYSPATGTTSEIPLATPLSVPSAQTVIQVGVALKVSPRGSSDETIPIQIEDSSSLRLTAASYHAGAPSLPCQ
jgi:prepilin-type N-terminal cleavage/methylation domain-containing protein